MAFYPPRSSFVQNKCFYSIQNREKPPILTPHKAKVDFSIFPIWFQVPHIPAAVTGFPEFKLFHNLYVSQ